MHTKSSFKTDEDINIILSPEFYWVKIFSSQVKSKKDFKSIVPTLFEEFINIENKKYHIIKLEDEKYLCFAYDEQVIIDGIKSSGLSSTQVKNIHFAQIEFASLVSHTNGVCLKIDNICLGFSNDILVQVPIQLQVSNSNGYNISSLELSKENIIIHQGSKYISPKNSYYISILLVILSLTFILKTILLQFTISALDSEIDTIKKEYKVPSSNIQMRSIIKKLKRLSKSQLKLRSTIKYIFDFRVKGKIVYLRYKNKQINIKYDGEDTSRFISYLQRKYKKVTSSNEKDTKVIRISL